MSVQAQHVELEEKKGLERRLVVTLAANQVDRAYRQNVEEASKKTRLPGFRAGNSPMKRKFIEKRYGQQLYQESVAKMTEDTLRHIFEEKELEPVATPQVEFLDEEMGKDVRYAATFDVFPEINWDDLSGIKIKVATSEVTEKAIEEGIRKVQDDQRDWQESNEPCQDGLQVTFDVLCQEGDEVLLDTRQRPESVIFGKDELLPDVAKALKGKCAGDSVEFQLSFPKDFHNEAMRGKKANCLLKVHHIKTSELPELNDAFYEKIGVEEKTREAFVKQVEEPLALELKKKLYGINRERLFQAMIKRFKCALPEALVKQELEELKKTNAEQEEKKQKKEKELNQVAERNVKLLVLIRSYLKAFDITLDGKRFDEHVRSLAFPFMDEKAFLQWFFEDQARVQRAQSEVLEQQVVEACLAKVKQENAKVAYDQVDDVLTKEQE